MVLTEICENVIRHHKRDRTERLSRAALNYSVGFRSASFVFIENCGTGDSIVFGSLILLEVTP